jgi:signal transduction histidine kinase
MQAEQMDLDGLRNPDFWKEYYQNVQAQIGRINHLLKDLWTASEKPAQAFADTVELRAVVAGAVESLRAALAAKNVTVENRIPDSLPPLHVDKLRFGRLFELLLKDEIASLPAGSRVVVSASRHQASLGDKEEIEVELKDNGPGLPEEALRLVFDPFLVRSDSPMEYGIHLMACYFIVHHHGGRIQASSQPGEGTTFRLWLPTHPDLALPPQQEHEFLQQALLNDTLWEKLISPE